MVQWLELSAFTAEGPGSIPGQETKIPQAVRCDQKKKNFKKNIMFDRTSLLGSFAADRGSQYQVEIQGAKVKCYGREILICVTKILFFFCLYRLLW